MPSQSQLGFQTGRITRKNQSSQLTATYAQISARDPLSGVIVASTQDGGSIELIKVSTRAIGSKPVLVARFQDRGFVF